MEASGRAARAWAGFLLHFVVVGALLPQALHWDGIGFLAWARDRGVGDPAHLAYPALIRLAHAALAPLGASLELAARLLSAAGLAGAFVVLGVRLERGGLAPLAATLVALLVTTAHLAWRQGGTVEPSTLALLALLSAGEAADAYAVRRTAGRLALLGAAVLALLALHVAGVVALPWLLHRARPRGAPRRHVLAAALVVAGLAAAAAWLAGERLALSARWAAGFLPRGAHGPALGAHALAEHGRMLLGVLAEGAVSLAPLAAAGALGALLGGSATRRALVDAALLALPHAALFLLTGKPVVALLMPVLPALGLAVAAGTRALARVRHGVLAAAVLLPAVLAYQAALSLLEAFHAAAAPDPRRALAERLAAARPPGALLLAGEVARHVAWWTDAPVAGLPDVVHDGLARHGAAGDPAELVRAALPELLGRPGTTSVWITGEGLRYLEAVWGLSPEGADGLVAPGTERLRLAGGAELVLLARRPPP